PGTKDRSRRDVLGDVVGLGVLGAALAAGSSPVWAQSASLEDVDLELVLAVDASGSVSQQRFNLQKQGYVQAFQDPRVARAIASGLTQSIAVTMFQWTGPMVSAEVIPWMKIADAASARAVAEAIAEVPRRIYGGGTSISGAIDQAMTLFGQSFRGSRHVIDISGDGANSSGRSVSRARDEAVAKGVVINGLPILSVEPDLDQHYQEEVIGGPGAFMIVIKDYDQFADAIIKKLIAEIS
ncbi:MAG: von Willebrand factor type domain protein, partial [Hyphomicrobiales bacterium]|nr:von Willebrand factor type domain protein [Hyphomicrobiales bacterium]